MANVRPNSTGTSLKDSVLTSPAPPPGLVAGTVFSLKAIFSQRELLVLLVQREIKSKYKDSALGLVWSLLRPLTQLMIYYVVIGQFLGAARSIPQFAIFVFAGLTAWTLFSESVSAATNSIVGNSGLIKKIYIPREVFPLAAVGSSLFNFLVQLGILIVATIVLGQFPLSWELLLLPLGFLLLLTFGLAIGLFFAAVNVYMRDLQHLVEVLLVILFWASPVVYSFKFVTAALGGGLLEQLYLANPISLGVMAFQKALWAAGSDEVWPENLELRILVALGVSLVLLWISQRVFARLEGNFAQEL